MRRNARPSDIIVDEIIKLVSSDQTVRAFLESMGHKYSNQEFFKACPIMRKKMVNGEVIIECGNSGKRCIDCDKVDFRLRFPLGGA